MRVVRTDLHTEKFGFKSDDIDGVTEELARATGMTPELHFYEGFGGDYQSFGKVKRSGGRLMLYPNRHEEVDGPTTHEEDFPELRLILLTEQRGGYVNYEPKLNKMNRFKPVLLYRSEYPDGAPRREVLFDLVKERSKLGP